MDVLESGSHSNGHHYNSRHQRHYAPQEKHISKNTACSKCNAQIPSGSKFCLECGEKVETTAFCISCGETLPTDAKFCSKCGAKTNN
ncbi:zinc ribbon domain-containing protein [Terrihalobacillus insolitus]|uniref:zinc ribbon domain-containing protein n=1 Tax=Terrihalobacillus insolitus TaxID=2950438 RepID=UPI003A9516B9